MNRMKILQLMSKEHMFISQQTPVNSMVLGVLVFKLPGRPGIVFRALVGH